MASVYNDYSKLFWNSSHHPSFILVNISFGFWERGVWFEIVLFGIHFIFRYFKSSHE